LAQGNLKWKITQHESFLHGQIAAAIIFALGLIIAIETGQNLFLAVFAVNLIFDFLFYLQPTPRTTSALLKIIISLNLIFLAYRLIFPGSAVSMF